jgi:hypothetical protein
VGVLESALRASGGLDLWRLTRRFIVHMSITGDLCNTKCSNAKLKELVVEGSTHVQELEMTGFARADIRAVYRRDWVALEGPDTHRVMKRAASPEEFRRGLQTVNWDELQLAHYCGYLIWNYMAVPFILADPDFETKELRRNVAPGESLRRLQVVFPARVVTHAPIQTFHFDREGLLRRLDYRAPHATHAPITQVYSGHQRFSGILVPTLCRLSAIGPNSGPVGKPALLDVEIFDVNFA